MDQTSTSGEREAFERGHVVGLQEGTHVPLKFDFWHKVIITIIAMGTVIMSVGGGYMVTSKMVDYRLTQVEYKVEEMKKDVADMKTFGHPDHERRIVRLETRADGTDKSIAEINGKLDTTIAILNRVEASVNAIKAKP